MTSSPPAPTAMRSAQSFERKVEESKPSKRDINWVIMDYLVNEGYPGAAEKFAQETKICDPIDIADIRKRVDIRHAIHAGKIDEAIDMINDLDAELLDHNHLLHFHLLQLQLVEIIRTVLNKPAIQADDFRPAIEFATLQLAPRAPTDPMYQQALERTMALMIFPKEKMVSEFKELLDLKLRESVATNVNTAILESRGQRAEAKIRQLVRARAWSEQQTRNASVLLPTFLPLGLDPANERGFSDDEDAMVQ